MSINRRQFLFTGAAAAFAGCQGVFGAAANGRVGVQLYSIREYIGGNKNGLKGVGLAQALKDVKNLGYAGVEFAGYYGNDAKTLKAMLDDAGLVACGTHVGRDAFSPANVKKTCESNLGYGNNVIICPGGGNFPGKDEKLDDFLKKLVDYYNKAAVDAAQYGCLIGLHNHTGEFTRKLESGETYWDYFFRNTASNVCMEQDVGWTTCAGEDPCAQYVKYPHRSPTLHAKENGMGQGVKQFDAILGQPGKDANGVVCAKGVDWDKLAVAADADGVKWWVVECERHANELVAIDESIKFLRSKGRC